MSLIAQVAKDIIFDVTWKILFIVKAKIIVHNKWVKSSPPPSQLCYLLSLEWLTYLEHVIQYFQAYIFLVVVKCTHNSTLLKIKMFD